jgi:hypothetical protein
LGHLATERVFSWLKLDDGAQGRQGRRYDYYQDRVSEVAPRGQNPLKGSPETQRATFFANVRFWKLLWNRNRLKGPSPLPVCPAGCLPVAGGHAPQKRQAGPVSTCIWCAPRLSTFPTGVVVEFAFSLPHSSPQSNISAKGNTRIRSTSRTRTP